MEVFRRMQKRLILLSIIAFTLGAQDLSEQSAMKSFSELWGSVLTSGQSSTAKINDEYQIEIGYLTHQFSFSDNDKPFILNGDTLSDASFNSIYTQIDLPISLQLGFRFGLQMKESEFNYASNMYGFSSKLQVSNFFWNGNPYVSGQIEKVFMKIDDQIEVNTFSLSGHISYEISLLTFNASAVHYTTNFIQSSADFKFREMLLKAGVMADLTYFKVYAEKSFNLYKDDISIGASIVF